MKLLVKSMLKYGSNDRQGKRYKRQKLELLYNFSLNIHY